jgi:hypothetical protein
VTVPAVPSEVVPLSELQLDLDESSTGWASHLADRGIEIVLDDLGRTSIARADARKLFDERRENEVRQREVAARREQTAIAADRQWRAQLPRGLHWTELPDGVPRVVAMTAADRAAQPKRLSPLQDALSGESMTFHRLPSTDEE